MVEDGGLRGEPLLGRMSGLGETRSSRLSFALAVVSPKAAMTLRGVHVTHAESVRRDGGMCQICATDSPSTVRNRMGIRRNPMESVEFSRSN